MATVVLLGTLDTKGMEYAYLRDQVEETGAETILIDVGIMGAPTVEPTISRSEIASAAGVDLERLAAAGDRGEAISSFARGASRVVERLYQEGRLQGIIGLGGSGGSALATAAMRALPIGVPKLMVSTMASGNTRPYVGASDVTMMYSVVDIAGINQISARILRNAARAIAAMASGYEAPRSPAAAKPIIGATMFGVTTAGVTAARQRLEAKGYEVLVFHATGTGGQSMEALAESGFLAGVLDLTTTELADELVGGVLSAGPDRLETAGKHGIPQVVSLGALDMVNFGPADTVPEQFAGRTLYEHNASVTLMRTTPDECAALGRWIAAKLKAASGPVSLFIPRGGVSAISTVGGVFHDPAADRALFDAVREAASGGVEVVESSLAINDEAFGHAMADKLDALIQQQRLQVN